MTSISANRKSEELKNLTKQADEKDYVIKSPFYNDEENNPCIKVTWESKTIKSICINFNIIVQTGKESGIQMEQNLSARCALEYHSDREICKDYSDNYIICTRFWGMVKRRRWLHSEYPLLPPPEEREAIKKQHIDEILEESRKLSEKYDKMFKPK